jgi:membrane glycosyltransferase
MNMQDAALTPAGWQAVCVLARRRLFVLFANLVTFCLLLAILARLLAQDGFSILDGAVLVLAAFVLPWTVMGFWNAALGLWLCHGRTDGLAATFPAWNPKSQTPLFEKTAIVMTIRNETPQRAFRRLQIVADSLVQAGQGHTFEIFVLSDSDHPDICAAEETAFAALQKSLSQGTASHYRRRTVNNGFKAGNLRDFCENEGRAFTFMLVLDADSVMTGEAIVRLVRIMQGNPKLGILQSLAVGTPTTSGFTRLFQFGMRQGMRPYTMGAAWWSADCGPFWGHNAVVRIAPFRVHCALPLLRGKPILSHDQIEAVLMRRAGYEVRVLPVEDGSYEDNPPDGIAFTQREMRWCQGNLQYLSLLTMPGLAFLGRLQLAWAIFMFLGLPASTLLLILAPFMALTAQQDFAQSGLALFYCAFLLLFVFPKLAGLADILLSRTQRNRYGGFLPLLMGAGVEIVFSFLLGAITSFHLTRFMLALLFRRPVLWQVQRRDAAALSSREVVNFGLAPTLFGLALWVLMANVSWTLLFWSLPLTLGYVVAIPFLWLTASPGFGRMLRHWQLAAIPEDRDPPAEIRALLISDI